MGKSSIILTFLETEISDQDLKEQQKQPIFNFSMHEGCWHGLHFTGKKFLFRIIMYVQFCTVHLSMWEKKNLFIFVSFLLTFQSLIDGS